MKKILAKVTRQNFVFYIVAMIGFILLIVYDDRTNRPINIAGFWLWLATGILLTVIVKIRKRARP